MNLAKANGFIAVRVFDRQGYTYVNYNFIQELHQDAGTTKIIFHGEEFLQVQDTPSEIINLINDNQKNV